MARTLNIALDLYNENRTVYKAKQGDVNSRFLLATITELGVPFSIPSNNTVYLKVRKPDQTRTLTRGVISDGKALVELTSQTLAVPGIAHCEIRILQNDPIEDLKTIKFKINVDSSVYSDEIVESTSQFTALEEALAAAGSIGKVSELHTIAKDTLVAGVNELADNQGTIADLTTTATTLVGAVNELDDEKKDKSNKVTSIDSESTDTQYPSAKLTYDQLALKEPNLPATPETPTEKFLDGNRQWNTPDHTKLLNKNTETDVQHLTAAQVTKLTNIEENAEVNIIETVSIDGADITPDANRNIDIPLATQTNDGALSLEDKIHIDSIEDNAEVNIVETISIDNVNVAPTDRNINLVLATAENDGMMSSEYAGKLDDIAENAEVNILEGIQIDGVDVGITLKKSDIPLATSTNDGAMSSEYAGKLDGIDENANLYVHPITAGNKHIPSEGSVDKILKWSADGTASWEDELEGKKYCKFVIGTSTSGYTLDDVDYLCDGTADQTEINAAIAALPAGGGEITILDGTYNITAKINLNKNNVTISGNGNSTILKRMYNSGSAEGVITLTSANYCKIKDLQIDGTKAIYTSYNNYGILLSACNYNTVTGNTCKSNTNGIFLNSSSSTNTITGNTCNSNTNGIFLNSSNNNNTVTGNTCNSNTTAGIQLSSSSNNTVTGNICNSNTSYGIVTSSSNNNTVTGNTCNDNNYGILLGASNYNTVTGNTSNNNNRGIYLSSGSNNNTVTGNTCIRGTGLPANYTTGQETIMLQGTHNNYNLIAINNCMGKAVSVEGGTGNSVYGNKWEENIDVVIKTDIVDNLTTNDSTKPLSAKQGSILAGAVDGIQTLLEAI